MCLGEGGNFAHDGPASTSDTMTEPSPLPLPALPADQLEALDRGGGAAIYP